MPAATTPIGRAAEAVRNAQAASARLTALVEKYADTGPYLREIASTLAIELALAEASLLAAQPRLHDQIEINGDLTIMGKIAPSAIWLNLDGVKA